MKTHKNRLNIEQLTNKDKKIYTSILNHSYVTENDVIVTEFKSSTLDEYDRIYADQIIGAEMGAIFASYPNIPLKAFYESVARDDAFSKIVPEYFYSCPTVDEMLFGHHPKTYYFDISRGGPTSVVRRSLGYLKLAQERHKISKDVMLKNWVAKYGIGSCVPVITFDNLVNYTVRNEAKMYAVPATSVAESLMACATYFSGMRSDVERITQKKSWVTGNGQIRNKGSLRIYEALHKYIIENYGHFYFSRLIKNGGSMSQIAGLYMEMAEKEFLLGKNRRDMSTTFAEIIFDPTSRRSHPNYGAQADCSELVVRGNKILDPVPWEAVYIYGDSHGSTKEQLLNMAKAIKKTLPKCVVVVFLDEKGEPIVPNYEENLIPQDADYLTIAWSAYLFESKIARQKSQLMLQQSATR
ncbi:MAG: hypothetical protein U0525_01600 [Patescibacteria group bacterium]